MAEAVEHLAGHEDLEIAEFEAGQVIVAADKRIDTDRLVQCNETVIVGAAAHRRDVAWIRNQFRTTPDGCHVRVGLCHRDPHAESFTDSVLRRSGEPSALATAVSAGQRGFGEGAGR